MAILKLKPSGKDYIWGGHKLVDNYGKEMTQESLRLDSVKVTEL